MLADLTCWVPTYFAMNRVLSVQRGNGEIRTKTSCGLKPVSERSKTPCFGQAFNSIIRKAVKQKSNKLTENPGGKEYNFRRAL